MAGPPVYPDGRVNELYVSPEEILKQEKRNEAYFSLCVLGGSSDASTTDLGHILT